MITDNRIVVEWWWIYIFQGPHCKLRDIRHHPWSGYSSITTVMCFIKHSAFGVYCIDRRYSMLGWAWTACHDIMCDAN